MKKQFLYLTLGVIDMGKDLIEKKPNEIEQLEEISQQEVIVLTPEEEFEQGMKKR